VGEARLQYAAVEEIDLSKPSAAGTRAPAPTRIGKYEIRRPLGKGAAGTVYLARDAFRDQQVALKVIDPDFFTHPAFNEVFRPQFETEASLAGKLDHPHIVSIYDAVLTTDTGHIVMEYVPGGNLKPYINDQNLLPIDSALEVAFKCCGALDYAFRHGIVHRDIKPANIMVGEGTDIKIGDFGAAYLRRGDDSQILRLGTPSYMSPEQIKEEPLTLHSDMFCLGIVVYELITGQRPFAGRTLSDLFTKIVSEDPLPPSRLRPSVPAALDAIVMRALSKTPAERYGNWVEFALDLAHTGRLRSLQQAVPDSEKYQHLRNVPQLAGLTAPQLWALVRAGQWSRAGANHVIVGEGERSDRLYFLAHGEAKVTKRGRLLNVIRAGEFFGEMSFISGGQMMRQATVESVSDVVLATFERKAIDRLETTCQLPVVWTLLTNLVDRLALADVRLSQTI
jgi:tRNA A-37 threonylcarbamoyl transferase component Bud32